jgi:tRNA threonylcarbamoyladenosine biosynthesis protein TsaB
MTILNIETSTSSCSAAITIDGQSVASRANTNNANHASELPVFVEQLLQEADSKAWHLDAVALSQGPGSYTGLRIGTSLAKGICYGRNIPLIPVDTLQVLCASIPLTDLPSGTWLCPMLDARRMEVYTALYRFESNQLQAISPVQAMIIDEQSFAEELAAHPIYFLGNGAEKCKAVITHPNAHFISNIVPQAKYMGNLAETKNNIQDLKQMAYYEPFYLKEFVAAPSHIKGLK